MSRVILLSLLLLGLLLGFAHGVALNADSQKALTALYDGTNGPSWTTTWDTTTFSTTFCSSYTSMVTCGPFGEIRTIKLANNNLVGTIPTEIGLLTVMTYLTFAGNQLSGTIPTELGNCANLGFFTLSDNDLDGNVPAELTQLKKISTLVLFGNKLSGDFPTAIAKMNNLGALQMADNQFTSLPTEYGPNMGFIRFERNQITNLPSQIFTSVLTNLRLSENQIQGTIPTEIGNAKNLVDFHILFNQLQGSIPTELAVSGVKRFWAYGNQLTGSVPTELVASTNLFDLRVMDNKLTGTISSLFGNSKLQFLWVSKNQLTGSIPSQLLQGQITSLNIAYNYFSGQLPSQIVYDAQLQRLLINETCISPITVATSIGDAAPFVPNPDCNPTNIGDYPPYVTLVPGAGASQVVGKYRFSQDSVLFDSSTLANHLVQVTANFASISIGQNKNPLNTGILVSPPAATFSLISSNPLSLTSTFSVEVLFSQTTVLGGTLQEIFAFSPDNTFTGTPVIRVLMQYSYLRVYLNGVYNFTPNYKFFSNRLYHVVFVYNGINTNKIARVYVNGVDIFNKSGFNYPVGGSKYLAIAKNTEIAIDELYVYNFVLSGAQVTNRYNTLAWCQNICATGTCTPTVDGFKCVS